MILISDQSANIFKDSFQRLRPCYDELVKDSVRLVKDGCGGKYGFFSAHASNSFSLAVFFGLLFKDFSKYPIYFTLIFASLISYSRVYLGVHYPLDILFGSLFGMGIINQPNVAILSTGAIEKKPVVKETEHGDAIFIRSMMYMTLGYDHRIIDGAYGSKFLVFIKKYLESINLDRDI